MIQTYAFLAMVTLQILVGSVLCPAWLIRRVQERVAAFPVERFAELFPGVDKNASGQRFVTQFRALNMGVAILGLLLLGWLFVHMRRPDWHQATVPALLTLYLLAQMSPLAFIGLKGARSMKRLRHLLADGKRKAILQRRGLFDFVSPLTVVLAVLSYVLFVGLVLYIRQHPFPGFGGLTNIYIITPVWVFYAFLAYVCLYGRNRNPVATHADRLYAIGVVVKACVYTCIAVTVFASLSLMLSLLHLQRWGLFAVSVFFLVTTVLSYMGMIVPPLRPKAQGLGSNGSLPPGTPDLSA
ncbi:MAG TPA: hypothetical protein VK700_12515 [Steroidobacteraceae bacterium]|jgi:hypothetical protein|nr:hypothetical protein [Steroidobacteraceae bacterium]